MKILSIDTSCDETAAAVTEKTKILSNIIWSQASLHAEFGGVFPTLAKREHEKRIDWVINRAIKNAGCIISDIDAVAVTVGPGLAIALEVGINKAKDISAKLKIPFISVNHIEGHVLSPLATSRKMNKNKNIKFPSLGIVASGGHTQIILIEKIGKYKILATTIDDALGEALDKAARMLGLGYPGGALLEKIAKKGDEKKHILPIPLLGQESRMEFSYSGIKTALYRKIQEIITNQKELTRVDIQDLAATFQRTVFLHFTRVLEWMIVNKKISGTQDILAGGGVMANIYLRKILGKLSKKYSMNIYFPYSKKMYGDNAGMIGIAAHFKMTAGKFEKDIKTVDRSPNAKIDQSFTSR